MEQLSFFPDMTEPQEISKPKKNKDWTGNYHSVCGCLGARNECKEEREEHDFYATDPIAAEWLMRLEHLNNSLWECACGEGHLSKVFVGGVQCLIHGPY